MTVVDELVGQLGDKPQMYHLGLVVPDVRAASEQYSDLFGMRWRSLRETVLPVRIDGQLHNADLLVTYSLGGPRTSNSSRIAPAIPGRSRPSRSTTSGSG
jgi:hypothetical protein